MSMTRTIAAVLGMMGCMGTAFAGAFEEQLDHGNAQLRSGDIEGALSTYREMQVEHPESDILYYSNGSAKYQEAEDFAARQAAEDAVASFEEAKEAFKKASTCEDGRVRTDSAYNHANTVAQLAKLAAAQGDREATVKGFEESVQTYEEFLRGHPDHEGAQHNLAHMRYLLKRMLQTPPPPPQENQEGEDEEQQEGDKQEQEESEGEQDQQDQSQEEKDEQQKQQQDQEEDKSEEEQKQDNQQSSDPQDQQQDQAQAQQGDQEPDEKDRQNIEAILQNLEEQDKREQQETRTARPQRGGRAEWW